jgi:hypothetical protein
VYRDPGLVVGEVGATSVSIWRGEVTRPRFEQQRLGLAGVARRQRPKAAFLCVVEESATAPGSELRKASAQMMDAHQDELCCAAMVIEGAGFKASLNRSVVVGMAMLMKERKYPVHYCATVHQAAAWMSKQMLVAAESFERDVESLRGKPLTDRLLPTSASRVRTSGRCDFRLSFYRA